MPLLNATLMEGDIVLSVWSWRRHTQRMFTLISKGGAVHTPAVSQESARDPHAPMSVWDAKGGRNAASTD